MNTALGAALAPASRIVAGVGCHVDSRIAHGGPGPDVHPVVFLHGAGGSGRQWAAVLAGLPSRFAAVVVDLPGHGTGRGRVPSTVADAAARVGEALAAVLPGRPAAVVGHSLGGLVALQLALSAPATVSHLVLVATAARLRLHPGLLEQFTSGEPDPDFFTGCFGPSMPAGAAATVFDDVRHVRPARPGCYLDTDDVDLTDRLGAITAPAAVLIARGDRVVSPRRSRAMAAGLGRATARELDGGHYLHLERPEQVQDVIADLVRPPRPSPPRKGGKSDAESSDHRARARRAERRDGRAVLGQRDGRPGHDRGRAADGRARPAV